VHFVSRSLRIDASIRRCIDVPLTPDERSLQSILHRRNLRALRSLRANFSNDGFPMNRALHIAKRHALQPQGCGQRAPALSPRFEAIHID
jgi:hypothetical protein